MTNFETSIVPAPFDQIMTDVRIMHEVNEEIKRRIRDQFTLTLSNILQACPSIVAISWCQYTPYFNDGDECTFRVSGPSIALSHDRPIVEYVTESIDCPLDGEVTSAQLSELIKTNSDDLFEVVECGVGLSGFTDSVYTGLTTSDQVKAALLKLVSGRMRYNSLDTYCAADQISIAAACIAINTLFKCIDDNVIQVMFGEHSRVLVTANDTVIEEYEHE